MNDLNLLVCQKGFQKVKEILLFLLRTGLSGHPTRANQTAMGPARLQQDACLSRAGSLAYPYNHCM
jgi:hypothetical protein